MARTHPRALFPVPAGREASLRSEADDLVAGEGMRLKKVLLLFPEATLVEASSALADGDAGMIASLPVSRASFAATVVKRSGMGALTTGRSEKRACFPVTVLWLACSSATANSWTVAKRSSG